MAPNAIESSLGLKEDLSNKSQRERVKAPLTIEFSGAAERNRTPDLLITNQLLYQLSYSSQVRHYKRGSGSRAIRNEPPQ